MISAAHNGIAAAPAAQAGRVCPVDYTYSPAVFDRAPDFAADILYVVGGLYGNLAALEQIDRMAAAEPAPVTIVYNGDYHWFDAEPGWFAAVERGVARHRVLRGNVETEIARDRDIGAGCGCAYPASVDADVVARSNEILAQLRDCATAADRRRLAALPMHRLARVGALRIGIVHGDAGALAGWRFDHDLLDDLQRRPWLNDIRRLSTVDCFASTHTCLAALRDLALADGRLTIVNNGAAGMPNFAGTRFGVLSRIAVTPSSQPPLYGLARDGVYIDALAVAYDHAGFLSRFTARWPQGSPAHQSYYRRIVDGAAHTLRHARPPAGP